MPARPPHRVEVTFVIGLEDRWNVPVARDVARPVADTSPRAESLGVAMGTLARGLEGLRRATGDTERGSTVDAVEGLGEARELMRDAGAWLPRTGQAGE